MTRDVPNPELEKALAEWQQRHHLRPDDPIFLLIELLGLYAKHGGLPLRHASAAEPGVTWWAAATAVVMAALGGVAIGRGW